MNVTVSPGTIRGRINAPPSKSLTHRAVIVSTLANGASVLENCLLADDTQATLEVCKSLGAAIAKEGTTVKVRGTGARLIAPSTPIDCGLSGTTLRFALALAALSPGETVLTGGKRLLERPVGPLIKALGAVDVPVTHEGDDIRVRGGNARGGNVILPGNVSSQFISALLMVGLYFPEGIAVAVEEPFYSRPYVDLTIELMREFGVEVQVKRNRFTVESSQSYKARAYKVEGDYSSAQYWFAGAAMTGGEVRVESLRPDSSQGDKKLLDILKEMGAEVKIEDGAITVCGGKTLKPFSVDGRDIPDLVPTLAVLAATAQGASEIIHIGHLRGKESDRLAAPVEELAKMGIHAEVKGDMVRVHGGRLKGAVINPHGDHRLAMAFAVAGLAAEGETVIEEAEVVSKSYPGFWEDLTSLGVVVVKHASPPPARRGAPPHQPHPALAGTMLGLVAEGLPSDHNLAQERGGVNIVLIGMRGSGKSTAGKMLAEKLGYGFQETDAMIEEHVGTSIANFVHAHGWEAFREKEAEAVAEAVNADHAVISCGGGVILHQANIEKLRENGFLVFLYAPKEILVVRLKQDAAIRPMLTDAATLEEDMARIWKERELLYRAAADIVINTAQRTPQSIVGEIYNILKEGRMV